MAKVAVKNIEGKKLEEIKLSDDVFGLEINEELVHQAFVAQYANQRSAIAHTKSRAERAGTGKKPWKQKGTGRARAGSVRSPLWRKGGITFGPTSDRNFSKKINRKMKTLATKMVLSAKLKDEEIVVVDNFSFAENKTKEAAKILNNLKIEKKVLWAFSIEQKKEMQASQNIKNVKNILVDNLNILDMLNNKFLLIDKDSIKKIEDRYSKNEKEEAKASVDSKKVDEKKVDKK